MTEQRPSNKPVKRRTRPLADLVGECLSAAFARQGFAAVEIVTHWEDIVGGDLARRSEPLRLIWPRRDDPDSVGTLTIRVEGGYALEIQHLAPVLIERVNRYFGWRCVGRIALRQGPVTQRARAPAAPIEPPPETVAEIKRGLGRFENEALKSSLARLGALVRAGVTGR
jgi:hypothetical protein